MRVSYEIDVTYDLAGMMRANSISIETALATADQTITAAVVEVSPGAQKLGSGFGGLRDIQIGLSAPLDQAAFDKMGDAITAALGGAQIVAIEQVVWVEDEDELWMDEESPHALEYAPAGALTTI